MVVVTFFSKFSFDTVVIHFLPDTFHFLTEPGIFCCDIEGATDPSCLKNCSTVDQITKDLHYIIFEEKKMIKFI